MYQKHFRTIFLGLLKTLLLITLIGCSATSKIMKQGNEAEKRSDFYSAANRYIAVLNMKPNHSKALTKLSAISKSAYEQKLQMAEGFKEQGNLENALTEYKELATLLKQLKNKNALTFVPINVEEAIRTVSAGAAEKRYVRAEELYKSGEYRQAIDEYQEALRLTRPYKDANEKIAESYYQIATNAEQKNRYRNAANNYVKSFETVRGYKDARVKATKLYYHLGNYFLSKKQCRNAFEDFTKARKINPQFLDLSKKFSSAKECATVKIAFVAFDNPTGRNLAGMALGDFIFETIKTKVQSRASQFIKLLDREQLSVLAQEQQISMGLIKSEAPVPTNLEGVHYLIFGKINQVQDVHPGLSKTPMQATYDYYYEVPYTDSKGKKRTKTEWAKGNMYFSLMKDSRKVKLAGAVRVVEAKTGAVAINHHIAESASDQIEYADNLRARHDLTAYNVSLDDEVKRLAKARRELQDVDTLAKQMIESIANSMSQKILSKLDRTPSVPDPAILNLESTISTKN